MAPYTRAQRRRLVLVAVTSILGGFAEAAVLVLIARIAFALTSSHDSVSFSIGPIDGRLSLSSLMVIAGTLVVMRVALQVVQVRIAARAVVSTVNATRKRLVNHYLAASWALQSLQRDGYLQELLTTYANQTSSAINAWTTVLTNTFSVAALLATALVVNAVASLGAALAALLIGLMLRPLRAAARRRASRTARSNLAFATELTELTSSLQEVRIFGVERQVNEQLGALNDRSTEASFRSATLRGYIPTIYIGAALFLIVAALAVAYAATFSRFAALGAVVLIMIRSLSYAQAIQTGVQSLHESAPYLDQLRSEEERYQASAVDRSGAHFEHIGALAFENVSFSYAPGQEVLRDISFAVRPGEIIGIVGPSGAGKSTLVQLLLRLREPTRGRILADRRDVRTLLIDDWYRHVTFVAQEARLLAGTVESNIRFYREDVDQAAIQRAAKLAHIHDDIMSWRLKYETPVGERGSQLSGGQRQRVCIARALAEEPEVVVLDEPTSALDVKSEALMRDTIAELAPNKTVFVIAHRLSTLSVCDRIMVILGGALEGFDEPARLEAENPFYREALRLSGMR